MNKRLNWLAARIKELRRDNPAATVRVERGQWQAVTVSYNASGASIVTPLSAWQSFPACAS